MIKKFCEIFEDDTKNVERVSSNEYFEKGIIAIVDQGKKDIVGYTNNENYKICNEERIIFGDHTRIFKYINIPFITGADGTKVLKIKENKNYDYKYFYYYLLHSYIPDTGYNRHFKWVKELQFDVVEYKKQLEIVKKLDKVCSIIKERKNQLKELEQLVKSQFVEMFEKENYDRKCLNDISIIKGEYGSGASAGEYINGQPRYVRITDIQEDGRLNNDSMASPKNENNLEKYTLDYGDILFARTGATVGKTYKYSKDDGYCIYAGYCIRFRLNLEKVNPDYIFTFTKTEEYKKWVANKQRVVAQPNINAKEYGNDLLIPIPPIELQNQFAEFVKLIDKQKFEIEKSLKEMEELYDSLMEEYFG